MNQVAQSLRAEPHPNRPIAIRHTIFGGFRAGGSDRPHRNQEVRRVRRLKHSGTKGKSQQHHLENPHRAE